jgi:thiol-disulfide isomerase/thioredoxin
MTRSFYRQIVFLLLVVTLPALAIAKEELALTSIPDGETVSLHRFHGHKTLLTFWRSDCPPCNLERPMLGTMARAHPELQVALVSLDGNAYQARHFPAPVAANMRIFSSQDDAGKTLRLAGDTHAMLPFSVFLRADGTACNVHYGLLGTAIVDDWMKQC